jgi:hypothetical protein
MYNAASSTVASNAYPKGGFTVLDALQRRLHDHARTLGFADPAAPPRTLPATGQSRAAGQRACHHPDGRPPPAPAGRPCAVTSPCDRRPQSPRTTDQHLAARAAELGFATLKDYLADRAVTRRWPSTSIAGELGVQPATVRDRLDQHRLPRGRATRRPYRAIQRQRSCWAAKRQARLAELRFADVEEYLRVRRVEQGWSLRRTLAELQVGSAWLKDQMQWLGHPLTHAGTAHCGFRVGRRCRPQLL